MSLERMPDESLVGYYENIRQQVEADRVHKHRFTAGPTVRQYADRLRRNDTKAAAAHADHLDARTGLTPERLRSIATPS
jgi:hypothetical protein